MASLTHVCMWSENGWTRITAEQAARIHPGGTVSARSGLFMCELCGQYVILTDGDYRVRHFKHSSHEKSKDCPERIFGTSYTLSYKPFEYNLPIKLTHIAPDSFQLQLGLIRIPQSLLTKNLNVEIQTVGINERTFTYSRERINSNGITYISIGDIPSEKYMLNISNGNAEIYNYWPRIIDGIDPQGTLFEYTSGKMLIRDSDVELGKKYFLLTQWNIQSSMLSRMGIDAEQISCKRISYSKWYIFAITATALNEDAAKFYLDLHYRLTNQPLEMQPVWPLYVEGGYVIKHNSDKTVLYIKGNAPSIKTFPNAAIYHLSKSAQPTVYEIICRNRQQLISAGRTKTLKYTYFWRESIATNMKKNKVYITDISGKTIESGATDKLPANGIIRFKSQYDGEIIIKKCDKIVEKRKIRADKTVEIDNLSLGMNIILLVGLDCVWELHLKKPATKNISFNENDMLNLLTRSSGDMMVTPHAIRNIARGFIEYPLIYKWINQYIHKGKINAKAYRTLQDMYRQITTKQQED